MDKQFLHIKTPLIRSQPLSDILGKTVYLKLENTQPAGSFKLRGIGHLCCVKAAEGAKHFVGSSGGNAGVTLAYIGQQLKIPTSIFVPESSNEIYRRAVRSYGAKLEVIGKVWDDCHLAAIDFCREQKATYIPPFDHDLIWEGHSTMIDEIKDEGLKPDAFITVVGGGGLLCGILSGILNAKWGDVPVFAVETVGAASFHASDEYKELVTIEKVDTIATSLGAKQITTRLVDWLLIRNNLVSVLTEDRATVNACYRFLNDHHMLVEPACGAGLSLIYDKRIDFPGENIVVIICGGIGISYELLQKYMQDFGIKTDISSSN